MPACAVAAARNAGAAGIILQYKFLLKYLVGIPIILLQLACNCRLRRVPPRPCMTAGLAIAYGMQYPGTAYFYYTKSTY